MRAAEKITVVTPAGSFETREPVSRRSFNGVECLCLSNPRNPSNPLVSSPEGTVTLIPVPAIAAIHIEPLDQKPLITT